MNKIRELREKAGKTQTDIAIELNVVQSTVAMWETGQNMPRADKLTPLAKILGCTVDELLEEDRTA